jgi:hypothetical protein
MNKPLVFLYEPRITEIQVFGSHWVHSGVAPFPHGEEALIAVYRATAGSDGQSVDVYVTAMPARFYTLRVRSGTNSVGDHKAPYEVATGSGAWAEAATIAHMISTGMLSFSKARP